MHFQLFLQCKAGIHQLQNQEAYIEEANISDFSYHQHVEECHDYPKCTDICKKLVLMNQYLIIYTTLLHCAARADGQGGKAATAAAASGMDGVYIHFSVPPVRP